MSSLKNKAHNLIDALPDDKMEKVLIILEGVKAIIADDVPDQWDLQLIKEAMEVEKNAEYVSLDDFAKELGFDVRKIQNNHWKKAAKYLKTQPKNQQERLLKAIYGIPNGNIKVLQGYENFYRLRVGDYRVIYRIDDNELIIIVLKIGSRGDIYKEF